MKRNVSSFHIYPALQFINSTSHSYFQVSNKKHNSRNVKKVSKPLTMTHQQPLNPPNRFLEVDEAQNLVTVYIQSGDKESSRIDVNVSLSCQRSYIQMLRADLDTEEYK